MIDYSNRGGEYGASNLVNIHRIEQSSVTESYQKKVSLDFETVFFVNLLYFLNPNEDYFWVSSVCKAWHTYILSITISITWPFLHTEKYLMRSCIQSGAQLKWAIDRGTINKTSIFFECCIKKDSVDLFDEFCNFLKSTCRCRDILSWYNKQSTVNDFLLIDLVLHKSVKILRMLHKKNVYQSSYLKKKLQTPSLTRFLCLWTDPQEIELLVFWHDQKIIDATRLLPYVCKRSDTDALSSFLDRTKSNTTIKDCIIRLCLETQNYDVFKWIIESPGYFEINSSFLKCVLSEYQRQYKNVLLSQFAMSNIYIVNSQTGDNMYSILVNDIMMRTRSKLEFWTKVLDHDLGVYTNTLRDIVTQDKQLGFCELFSNTFDGLQIDESNLIGTRIYRHNDEHSFYKTLVRTYENNNINRRAYIISIINLLSCLTDTLVRKKRIYRFEPITTFLSFVFINILVFLHEKNATKLNKCIIGSILMKSRSLRFMFCLYKSVGLCVLLLVVADNCKKLFLHAF